MSPSISWCHSWTTITSDSETRRPKTHPKSLRRLPRCPSRPRTRACSLKNRSECWILLLKASPRTRRLESLRAPKAIWISYSKSKPTFLTRRIDLPDNSRRPSTMITSFSNTTSRSHSRQASTSHQVTKKAKLGRVRLLGSTSSKSSASPARSKTTRPALSPPQSYESLPPGATARVFPVSVGSRTSSLMKSIFSTKPLPSPRWPAWISHCQITLTNRYNLTKCKDGLIVSSFTLKSTKRILPLTPFQSCCCLLAYQKLESPQKSGRF